MAEHLADFVRHDRTRITEGVVLEMHGLTIADIYPCAGNYRDALTRIEITDTDHHPAHPSQVRIEVVDMLEWLYSGGEHTSPLNQAAYVLWKVNHIHPFNGGNGRVARALAYLVMVSKVAPIFTGEPLPAKLKKRTKTFGPGVLPAADHGNFLACLKIPPRITIPKRNRFELGCAVGVGMPELSSQTEVPGFTSANSRPLIFDFRNIPGSQLWSAVATCRGYLSNLKFSLEE